MTNDSNPVDINIITEKLSRHVQEPAVNSGRRTIFAPHPVQESASVAVETIEVTDELVHGGLSSSVLSQIPEAEAVQAETAQAVLGTHATDAHAQVVPGTHAVDRHGLGSATIEGESEAQVATSTPAILPANVTNIAPTEAAPSTRSRICTRSQSGISKKKVYSDGTIRYDKQSLFTATGEPQFLEEALAHKEWKHAMDLEYEALIRNNTWHLVPPKEGRNIIDCKWVYKVKRK
ncbi:hypothetical protein GUJ93_ZPchr0009g646, partial [Zizania palustris]